MWATNVLKYCNHKIIISFKFLKYHLKAKQRAKAKGLSKAKQMATAKGLSKDKQRARFKGLLKAKQRAAASGLLRGSIGDLSSNIHSK